MKKILLLLSVLISTSLVVGATTGCTGDSNSTKKETGDRNKSSESMSFIVLGDMHYCDTAFYDLNAMLADKPGDYRQITATYAPVASANWADQIAALKTRMDQTLPPVKCIVQLGDISEGLANVEGYADNMAANIVNIIRGTQTDVPWLLVKGNHDITGVGVCKSEAKSAFGKFYTPFIREQTGNDNIEEATYSFQMGDVLFVVLDAYNNDVNQIEFAKSALENSTAKYKFVCMHEPAVPASERCWHYLRSKPIETRNEFLKVLAENRAIMLAGHLHRYSVLRRKTEWGPIIQVMTTSVTSVQRKSKPSYQLSTEQYGEYLVDWKSDWTPSTAAERKAILAEEAKYVDYYKMNNLAGYAVISIDAKKEEVVLRYYPAFESEAYDEINLTKLYNRK